MGAPVEFEQVQGIVRFGYRKLTECVFLLLAVKDAAAARRWIAAAPVSDAVSLSDSPKTALQIAFTHEGLEQLGCEAAMLAQFSMEFRSGLGENEARSRLLGDVGDSAPGHWLWGSGEQTVHLLVMLYAQPGMLDSWRSSLTTGDWNEAFRVVHELDTVDLGGVEPFGFPDGISQPEVDWERMLTSPSTQDTYSNQAALGEFLLGYPNEYSRYTDRPLVPDGSDAAEGLPPAEDTPGKRDFGRNGCYLVLRTLEQDVAGFWTALRRQAGTGEEAEFLAEKMVGRHKNGEPLTSLEQDSIPGVAAGDQLNRFHFNGDPNGVQCPFGAHVRRANPRNGDLPYPTVTGLRRLLALVGFGPRTLQSDAKASTRFHRILRRGREYGPAIAARDIADAEADSSPRGIHFLCLAGNIARQFEFLQSAWIMSTKFDAMTDESDPLLGSREPIEGTASTDTFSIPRVGGAGKVLCGLPRFVSVRGGAYFFLPSLPALRYLSRPQ